MKTQNEIAFEYIYKMKLGERFHKDLFDIWRVPGGWLFGIDGGDTGAVLEFVPFDNEFMKSSIQEKI